MTIESAQGAGCALDRTHPAMIPSQPARRHLRAWYPPTDNPSDGYEHPYPIRLLPRREQAEFPDDHHLVGQLFPAPDPPPRSLLSGQVGPMLCISAQILHEHYVGPRVMFSNPTCVCPVVEECYGP